MAGYAHGLGLANNTLGLAEQLKHRESEGNTLIAENLANPHVQSENVIEVVLLFVKLSHSILGWEGSGRIDRFLVTLLPVKPAKHDITVVQDFYRSLADERVMYKLTHGTENDIQAIFGAKGKWR